MSEKMVTYVNGDIKEMMEKREYAQAMTREALIRRHGKAKADAIIAAKEQKRARTSH